ncbi:MAG: tRNA (N6-isopentenyl adenosine(37)-C2)-methylthiotransferase MiaB [Candidatus Peregrinibacteria bacterium]
MKTYYIQTYGCQMNYSDSERIQAYLNSLNLKPAKTLQKADLILLNTCSVKQKAEDKVLGQLRKIHKLKNPITAITGCMARTTSSRYSALRDSLFTKLPQLDLVIKNDELPQLASLLRELNPKLKIKHIKEESLTDYLKIKAAHNSTTTKSQALIPISNGCDKFCTYCIVPYARGREKSRPINEILTEAEQLVSKGTKEITLVGQTVNSYGKSVYDKQHNTFKNLKTDPFTHLLKKLDQLHKKGLKRLRFTSPHPKDMTPNLIETLASLPTIMPYIHLPLQSGSDTVLKRMNRSYTTSQYKKIILSLRKAIPGISISTDIIVGFCGETEKEFNETLALFKELNFEFAYLAKYSNRKGTTADRFLKDDIPIQTKKKRWDLLNEQLKKQSKNSLKNFVGKTVHVLVETKSNNKYSGRSEHFKTVQFCTPKPVKSRTSTGLLLGKIVPIKITKSHLWHLEGKLT